MSYHERLTAWLLEMPTWPANYGQGHREEVLDHLVELGKWADNEPEENE